ncbi:peroxiredoxin, SACOL1771 subfamily [Paenibacillus algorifonticola]|uniref:Peroxiredoxin, SACOL1771 subfamily n=1 Tax=Paenibacillus algorifonticola TaxID=684063 RepID=A0A1I2IUA6_9BACL|nr:OsmC family protein [Paenibacillus algorifonticola]SFF45203.1 peroxiredoxin, SACOL1771 subfamily [Paenibacillus algorifonticola]
MADMKSNLNTVWYKDTKGSGRLKADYLKTNIAIPESSGGSGEGANPKELLVSSATTCYIMTLVYMLEQKKLSVTGIVMNTEAVNSKEEGLRIVHLPQVILSANSTEEHLQSVRKIMISAEQACEVGNLLKKAGVLIEVEGKVEIESDTDLVSQYIEENQLNWD